MDFARISTNKTPAARLGSRTGCTCVTSRCTQITLIDGESGRELSLIPIHIAHPDELAWKLRINCCHPYDDCFLKDHILNKPSGLQSER